MTNRAEEFNAHQRGSLPDLLGITFEEVEADHVRGHLTVRPGHMAPNGYLHAATIVALADTACGYGCVASLPQGATGFTTIELKANYLSTARNGHDMLCEARLTHGGRMTQVWDAEVTNVNSGKVMALFRCTQMLLYPH